MRRSVVRTSAAATVAAVLSFASIVPVHGASDAVDQAQTLTIGLQRSIPIMAQTFTAGATGQLDRVSLAYDTTGTTSLRVSIRSTTASGVPTGTVLAGPVAWSGTALCCRQFHDFTFNPTFGVVSGTKYAIVVQQVGGVFTWYSDASIDAYAGGQLYVGSTWLTGAQWGDDFAFKTWLVAGPPLTADNSSVTAPEGTAPMNTGTFSGGDATTLSASAGHVTKSGAGTWSWTGDASDEAGSQTVTITATDASGSTTSTTFGVVITKSAPQAQIVTDPTEIPEGTLEPFTGAAHSPSQADNVAGLDLTWRVTKNGNPYASGSGTNFSFTPDDEGTFVVTFTATDDGGMSGSDSLTMIGTNVAPTASMGPVGGLGQLVTLPQQLLSFSGGFTDPGALDTHTATWDFGDGTSASGFAASHAYAAAGTYRVTLTVTDDDGGVGKATTTVAVQTTQQALSTIAGAVQRLSGLNAGQKNSLVVKLNAASASTSRGDFGAANNQLNAFLNELQADEKTGKISATDAANLRNAVHAVKGSIGTFNRFLEWWPLAL